MHEDGRARKQLGSKEVVSGLEALFQSLGEVAEIDGDFQ